MHQNGPISFMSPIGHLIFHLKSVSPCGKPTQFRNKTETNFGCVDSLRLEIEGICLFSFWLKS